MKFVNTSNVYCHRLKAMKMKAYIIRINARRSIDRPCKQRRYCVMRIIALDIVTQQCETLPKNDGSRTVPLERPFSLLCLHVNSKQDRRHAGISLRSSMTDPHLELPMCCLQQLFGLFASATRC